MNKNRGHAVEDLIGNQTTFVEPSNVKIEDFEDFSSEGSSNGGIEVINEFNVVN